MVERLEPGIAVRLEQAGEGRQVRGRVLAAAVGAVEVDRRRSRLARERVVIAHVDPQAPRLGPAKPRRQHRNGGVVAVDLLGREDMPPDCRRHRVEQPGRLTDPVAQRRAVELDPLAGVDLGLAIQRDKITEVGQQQIAGGPHRRAHLQLTAAPNALIADGSGLPHAYAPCRRLTLVQCYRRRTMVDAERLHRHHSSRLRILNELRRSFDPRDQQPVSRTRAGDIEEVAFRL